MAKRKPRRQECVRKYHGRCLVCGEPAAEVLDCHRPLPGSEGGKYQRGNMMTLCANHHRKAHAGSLTVHGRRLGTMGHVWHCEIDGEERFIPDTPYWAERE